MKKLLLVGVLFSFVGYKMYAGDIPTDRSDEPSFFMCEWNDLLKTCVTGNDNYCICVVD